jgi:hypothetical protein
VLTFTQTRGIGVSETLHRNTTAGPGRGSRPGLIDAVRGTSLPGRESCWQGPAPPSRGSAATGVPNIGMPTCQAPPAPSGERTYALPLSLPSRRRKPNASSGMRLGAHENLLRLPLPFALAHAVHVLCTLQKRLPGLCGPSFCRASSTLSIALFLSPWHGAPCVWTHKSAAMHCSHVSVHLAYIWHANPQASERRTISQVTPYSGPIET